MIGYNIGKINELLGNVAKTHEVIGETLISGWSTVSKCLQSNWIGPDELAFEKELASVLRKLYGSCYGVVTQVVANIAKLGDTWKNFQKQNVMEGTTANEVGIAIAEVSVKDFDISSLKEGEISFSDTTNFGLSDANAGKTIMQVITEYTNQVNEKVRALYSEVEAKSAFMGTEQSTAIESYLISVRDAIVALTTTVKNLEDTLTQLTANYSAQEQEMKRATDAAKPAANVNVNE